MTLNTQIMRKVVQKIEQQDAKQAQKQGNPPERFASLPSYSVHDRHVSMRACFIQRKIQGKHTHTRANPDIAAEPKERNAPPTVARPCDIAAATAPPADANPPNMAAIVMVSYA